MVINWGVDPGCYSFPRLLKVRRQRQVKIRSGSRARAHGGKGTILNPWRVGGNQIKCHDRVDSTRNQPGAKRRAHSLVLPGGGSRTVVFNKS